MDLHQSLLQETDWFIFNSNIFQICIFKNFIKQNYNRENGCRNSSYMIKLQFLYGVILLSWYWVYYKKTVHKKSQPNEGTMCVCLKKLGAPHRVRWSRSNSANHMYVHLYNTSEFIYFPQKEFVLTETI